MATERLKLIFEIVTQNKAAEQLRRVQKEAASVQNKFKGSAQAIKLAAKNVDAFASKIKSVSSIVGGLAIAAGTVAAGFVLNRAVQEAVALENALLGLKSVARNTGNDVEGISDIAKELASDGLIPLSEVSASLKKLTRYRLRCR